MLLWLIFLKIKSLQKSHNVALVTIIINVTLINFSKNKVPQKKSHCCQVRQKTFPLKLLVRIKRRQHPGDNFVNGVFQEAWVKEIHQGRQDGFVQQRNNLQKIHNKIHVTREWIIWQLLYGKLFPNCLMAK